MGIFFLAGPSDLPNPTGPGILLGRGCRLGRAEPLRDGELLKKLPEKLDVAVIGPTTAAAAEKQALTVTIQPDTATIPGLVDAITANYQAVEDS